jgi:polyribonucleotide nucleotidyltransferase
VVRESILSSACAPAAAAPDIRPITCEIDLLPRTRLSLFHPQGDPGLAVTTLGTVFDEQIMDDIEGDNRKNFMLHYNFPPFSVGETGRLGAGRREIGHGNLAERSIRAVLPGKETFPYTIRIVSEVLESNGSSSMATVCGSTLSLLNAGVPIRKSVAGIAMGLVKEGERFEVLSDILGEEDHLGDMDFKVAGTEEGITGFQMDIKIAGVSSEILSRALEQAREGRLSILEVMGRTIREPRESISDYAPKIISLKIDQEKIGAVIGPGGKVIKSITERTGAEINIENDGTVTIYCRDKAGADQAHELVKGLVQEPEVNRWYTGTVRRIMDFGAFVEFMPGKEGLVHISRMAQERVNAVSDVLKEGQEVKVKLFEIDRMGRLNLSMIELPEGYTAERRPPPRDRDHREGGYDRPGGGREGRPRGDGRPRGEGRPDSRRR